MEVVSFAQRLPLASTASLWALLVRICTEDCGCMLHKISSAGATAQLYGHSKITLQDELWPRNAQVRERAAAFLPTHLLSKHKGRAAVPTPGMENKIQ